MRFLTMLAGLLTAASAAAAQQVDVAPPVDTVFARWNSTHSPGCAVGIAKDGQVLLTRGYGMANLETGTPITGETIFESGSVAKQFTAAAVLLLALDGKLALDDPVRKYMPEMPEYDRPITIRHLLTHTSGLREWSSLVAASGWPRGQRAHTQADLLDVVFRQRALNYPVGDYYSYTNSGYAVAMSLVERVSGKSLQEFSDERMFRPLGMTKTRWRDDFTRIVPGRAQAYSRENGEWRLNMPFESVVGPGGLLTTVGDWLKWNDAISRNVLAPRFADLLTQRMRLTSGREIEYALGVFVANYRGVREISHSGSTGGYSTFLARYPDHGNLSIAVLCNSTIATPGPYVRQMAGRLIARFPPVPPLDTAEVHGALLTPRIGIYQSERSRTLLLVDSGSVARLRALPDGWLWSPNQARWRFEGGRLLVAQPDGDTVSFARVAERRWTPTPRELQAYVGTYRSEEIGATYELKVVGDSLAMSTRPGRNITLRPVFADAFTRGSGGSTVWFTRNRGGRVTAMHFSEPRLWDLVLQRVR